MVSVLESQVSTFTCNIIYFRGIGKFCYHDDTQSPIKELTSKLIFEGAAEPYSNWFDETSTTGQETEALSTGNNLF